MIDGENLECVRLVLEAGADPNQEDVLGVRPLHVAAEMGDGQTCEMLLKAGANPNAVDRDLAETPAGWAKFRKHYALAERLDRVSNDGG